MKQRLTVLFLIFVVVLAVVPGVSAQEAGCFDLPQEDCAIINAASVQSGDITSFVQEFSISLTVVGLDQEDPEAESYFEVSGVGPFVFVPDAEIPVAMSMDMYINTNLGEEPIEGEFPFALVDGMVYIPSDEGVVGFPADAEDAASALEGFGLEGMGLDPAALAGGTDDMNPADLGGLMGEDPTQLAALLEMLIGSYVNYVRLPDEDLMGATVYPFEWTFDATGFFQSEEFLALFDGLMEGLAPDEAGAEGEGDELAQTLAIVPMLLASTDAELVITQSVGADDNYIHELEVYLDLSAMGLIDAEFTFNVILSEINNAPAPTAPEGARILTEEEVEEMMGS